MAGNAMFIVESSEITNAPAAAAHRIMGLGESSANVGNVHDGPMQCSRDAP
jgi:hypothetical protein